jgi:hypothetical protein
MSNIPEINGLPLPPLLIKLIQSGRWQHPGDDVVKEVIPFLREPVDFYNSVEKMSISREYLFQGKDTVESLRLVKGQKKLGVINLPWLDVDQAIFIAVNRIPGDDIAIVLDYRVNRANPRVVASDWWDEESGCIWKEVYTTFSDFAKALRL